MLPNITLDDIIGEFGKYYVNGGQNERNLGRLLLQRSKTPSICTPITTDNTEYRHALASIGSVVQAFQKHFTPKGSLEFSPRTIKLNNIKIDAELYPDDIKYTWLGFWENLDENDRSKWPIVRWFLEYLIIPKKEHELEVLNYYKGEYKEPTANTAGASKNAMNGLRLQIKSGLASGRMKSLSSVLSGVNADNIFDGVENAAEYVEKEYPELIEETNLQFCMPNNWMKAFLRDKRNTHGTDVNYDPNKVTVDFYDNLKLVGLPSMVGTNDFFITPQSNLLYLKRTSGMKRFEIQKQDRLVKFLTDWYEGIGFAYDEFAFAHIDGGSGSGS